MKSLALVEAISHANGRSVRPELPTALQGIFARRLLGYPFLARCGKGTITMGELRRVRECRVPPAYRRS